jgi:hypothetical protein
MLSPTRKGRLSTVDGTPPLRRMSSARWRRPVSRAAAARLDGLGQRARVAGQRVRRSQRLDKQCQREPGAFAALGVEVDLVDQSHDGSRVDQVGLHEPAVDRVVCPRRVREALVALGRLHAAAADRHVGEIGASSETRREHQRRIDGGVPCEPGEGGGHLRAGQADEGMAPRTGGSSRSRRLEGFTVLLRSHATRRARVEP